MTIDEPAAAPVDSVIHETPEEAASRRSRFGHAKADRGNDDWTSLRPWEKAAEWKIASPTIANEIIELAHLHASQQIRIEAEHARYTRRLELRIWILQLIEMVLLSASVVVLALVAGQYADAGNAIPGLIVSGSGLALMLTTYGIIRATSQLLGSTPSIPLRRASRTANRD